jgi:hypothetical protein
MGKTLGIKGIEVAEREGFEPSVPVTVHTLSKRIRRHFRTLINTAFSLKYRRIEGERRGFGFRAFESI